MIVGRIKKDQTDHRRVLIDLKDWIDAGETVSIPGGVSVAFEYDRSLDENGEPIPDVTPLVVSAAALTAFPEIYLMLGEGTRGVTYLVTTVVIGSTSNRWKTIELHVEINMLVPGLDPVTSVLTELDIEGLPTSPPATANSLWNNGGVLCVQGLVGGLPISVAFLPTQLPPIPYQLWDNNGMVCIS